MKSLKFVNSQEEFADYNGYLQRYINNWRLFEFYWSSRKFWTIFRFLPNYLLLRLHFSKNAKDNNY